MRWLLTLVLVLLVAPASAQAALSVEDSLRIADRYWGPHECAGRVVVTMDPTLNDRGANGEATGLVATWNGTDFDWRRVSCDIAIMPGLDAGSMCAAIVHEVGHLVNGPAHTGPMAPGALNPTACSPTPTRADVRALIAESLSPAWRITCTPASYAMRCKARRGTQERRYFASVTPTQLSWSYLGQSRVRRQAVARAQRHLQLR
jgi:hypothetical protein